MPKQLSLSRGIDSHFEEILGQSKAWVEELRKLAESRFPTDALANAEANLEVAREFFSKWSMEVLVSLYSLHAAGFEELRRHLRGVTPRVLSGKLKALEARHLIVRRVLNDHPPRVQYRLAPDGLTLVRLGEPAFLYLRLHGKPPR
ncbi:MAG TPA: helix-turn-helix domain-containing protein [Thermoplasmata archaeon]|nr:helix-turn-helix domain-containing protein [Thermoplasmata archaeon]